MLCVISILFTLYLEHIRDQQVKGEGYLLSTLSQIRLSNFETKDMN